MSFSRGPGRQPDPPRTPHGKARHPKPHKAVFAGRVHAAAGFYDTKQELWHAVVTEPEAVASLGLCTVWREVMRHYYVMRDRMVSEIRLRTEADAVEAELSSAQEANAITVMAAALLAADNRPIVFLAPQERSDEDKELLRAVARSVYRDYSHQAYDGLNQLVEANRHFGTTKKFTIADRLLHSVSREVDPELKRMPVFVRGIEAALGEPRLRMFRVAS